MRELLKHCHVFMKDRNKNKRISFNDSDADRIYEWRLAMLQLMGESCCEHCDHIEERIKKFIGEKSARFLQKQVKKHPYFIKGKVVE